MKAWMKFALTGLQSRVEYFAVIMPQGEEKQ